MKQTQAEAIDKESLVNAIVAEFDAIEANRADACRIYDDARKKATKLCQDRAKAANRARRETFKEIERKFEMEFLEAFSSLTPGSNANDEDYLTIAYAMMTGNAPPIEVRDTNIGTYTEPLPHGIRIQIDGISFADLLYETNRYEVYLVLGNHRVRVAKYAKYQRPALRAMSLELPGAEKSIFLPSVVLAMALEGYHFKLKKAYMHVGDQAVSSLRQHD